MQQNSTCFYQFHYVSTLKHCTWDVSYMKKSEIFEKLFKTCLKSIEIVGILNLVHLKNVDFERVLYTRWSYVRSLLVFSSFEFPLKIYNVTNNTYILESLIPLYSMTCCLFVIETNYELLEWFKRFTWIFHQFFSNRNYLLN